MGNNKFKIGDMVRVLVNEDITGYARYPVGTKRLVLKVHDLPHACIYDVGIWRYKEDELELVERAPEVKNSKTYEQGLEEGWKLAGIVGNMEFYKRNDIFGLHDGNNGMGDILKDFTAAEILKKLKEYENNYIRPGDIVKVKSIAGAEYIGMVTQITDNQNSMCILYNDGSVEMTTKNNMIEKTGQYIDISELLNNIGKES